LDQSRTHNAANELTQIAGSSSHVAHDRCGNMTRIPKPDDWSAHYDLTYDAWNRLVKVMDGQSTVATYAYDARNFRVTKTVSGTTRHYYYNTGWQCLEERLYCHQDPNWNVVAITNTSGAAQERYTYDAYGRPTFLTGSFGSRSSSSYAWETLFAGYRWDSEVGRYQIRERYLGSPLGCWQSRDAIGYKGGINLYEYVGGRPGNGTDPSGYWAPSDHYTLEDVGLTAYKGANPPIGKKCRAWMLTTLYAGNKWQDAMFGGGLGRVDGRTARYWRSAS